MFCSILRILHGLQCFWPPLQHIPAQSFGILPNIVVKHFECFLIGNIVAEPIKSYLSLSLSVRCALFNSFSTQCLVFCPFSTNAFYGYTMFGRRPIKILLVHRQKNCCGLRCHCGNHRDNQHVLTVSLQILHTLKPRRLQIPLSKRIDLEMGRLIAQ